MDTTPGGRTRMMIAPALEAYAICTCILVCLAFFYRITV